MTQLQQLQRAVGPTGSDCSGSVQRGRPLLFFCTCCTWWSRRWLPDEPYENVVWQLKRPLQAPLHALRSVKRFVRPLPALPACSQFRISQKLPTLRRVVQKSPSVVIPCLANLMATLPASGQSDPTHIPFSTAVTIVDIKDDVAVLRSLQHPKKVSCTHCSGLLTGRPGLCGILNTMASGAVIPPAPLPPAAACLIAATSRIRRHPPWWLLR